MNAQDFICNQTVFIKYSPTETWLDNEFTDSDIKIDGYVPERVDRKDGNLPFDKDGSGGVLIYISDKRSYTHRDDFETNNVDSIWIELTPKNHPSHLICIVYRSQAHSLMIGFSVLVTS